MRSKFLHIYIFICSCIAGTVNAQCPGGGAPQQISELRKSGIPHGMATFDFDQFDPSLGTLIGASVRAKVTGVIQITVFNYNIVERGFEVTVDRIDYFSAPALGVHIMVDSTAKYNTPLLAAAQYPGDPPDYSGRVPNGDFSNRHIQLVTAPLQKEVIQQITNPSHLAEYVGTGSIELQYELDPGFGIRGPGSSQTESGITTFSTEIEMEIVYTYCPFVTLAEGKTSFNATKGEGNNVLLTWTKENETVGTHYTPEISQNGRDFSGIISVESQPTETRVAKYHYNYHVPVIDNGTKLYFRLKQMGTDGKISYSNVATLSYNNTSEQFKIYPNPAKNYVTINFEMVQRSPQHLSLINSAGLVLETETINAGAKTHNYRFKQNHPPGVYFIRVANASTRQQQVLRLMIE